MYFIYNILEKNIWNLNPLAITQILSCNYSFVDVHQLSLSKILFLKTESALSLFSRKNSFCSREKSQFTFVVGLFSHANICVGDLCVPCETKEFYQRNMKIFWYLSSCIIYYNFE